MHVVAIPFLDESPAAVAKNLHIAASHPSVDRVWGITRSGPYPQVFDSDLAPIEIIAEERIGNLRRGKGDAMNTAIAHAHEMSVQRLHFYDADITNFGPDWITGAERAAGEGFEVVRHGFPRAATDAMITWMITKPVLAMKFAGTLLPRIGQPLGGELLLGARAIAGMARSDRVRQRSDWGIDTEITFETVAGGYSLYEHHVREGKRHSLYGSLSELRQMALECFDSVATLPLRPIPEVDHFAELVQPVPADLRVELGFSVGATLPLLTVPWAEGEMEYVHRMPEELGSKIEQMTVTGEYDFLDEDAWGQILQFMLVEPSQAGPALFRLWVGRVLHYTKHRASKGYDHALEYLAGTIEGYETA